VVEGLGNDGTQQNVSRSKNDKKNQPAVAMTVVAGLGNDVHSERFHGAQKQSTSGGSDGGGRTRQ